MNINTSLIRKILVGIGAVVLIVFFFSVIDTGKAITPLEQAKSHAEGLLVSKKEEWQKNHDEFMKVDAYCQAEEERLRLERMKVEQEARQLREIIETVSDFTRPMNLQTEGR
jgi:signal transduction histidine kinase